MKADLGLESTREVRKSISREHGNDPRRLVEYYMEYQRRFSRNVEAVRPGLRAHLLRFFDEISPLLPVVPGRA